MPSPLSFCMINRATLDPETQRRTPYANPAPAATSSCVTTMLPRIADLAGEWEVARMTGRIPYPYSVDQAQHWVTGLAEGEVVRGIKLNGELIGICGYAATGNGTAEIGYWIGKPYWGHGYATEAARHLMQYGFTKGGIRRFTCCHFTENPARSALSSSSASACSAIARAGARRAAWNFPRCATNAAGP